MSRNPHQYSFNHSSNILNTRNSNNTTHWNPTFNNYHTTRDHEESQILSWISPLESWRRHSDVARTRAEGVGDWVLETREFQTWWGDGSDAIVFCRGAPGAGKTFICSLIVDALCNETVGLNVAVGCVYCDYRGQKEQTPAVMIGSLLRQFVAALPEAPEAITEAFQTAKSHLGGQAPQLSKIMELFSGVLVSFQQVFICVDALDELLVEYKVEFMRSLRQILERSPNAKLFLTGRPHIQSEIGSGLPLATSIISIQPRLGDVEGYLEKKLDNDPVPEAMDESLRSEIITKISQDYSESFLLVTLNIDAILGEVTINGRRKKLGETTNVLSDAYTATLERIKRQQGAKAKLGIAALMWISFAGRPLSVDELCHALAMEVGSRNIDIGSVPSVETIVGSCLGVVTVDHATSTVRLVHATLQEYLRGHHNNVFESPHATIAEACLRYLGMRSVRDLPSNIDVAPPTLPLLSYASSYWGTHARTEFTPSVRYLALEIVGQYPQHVAANILTRDRVDPCFVIWSRGGLTSLHCVAYFGMDKLLEELLEMGRSDLNQTDHWRRTPLNLAAEHGHERVVRILLDRTDVNPNLADWSGKTPLYQAAENGHEGVVRMLLDRTDVNPNLANLFGETPLSEAAERDHEGVVRILLDRADVNPNIAQYCYRTPLFLAAAYGHEGVVRILLGRVDVNPNLADRSSETPLCRAAAKGYERVARILLARPDLNPNLANGSGETPLYNAARHGYEGIVRMFLDRTDVNPNLANRSGETPLHRVAVNGHEGMVRMLLDRTDANPRLVDIFGKTPLDIARMEGHWRVLHILENENRC